MRPDVEVVIPTDDAEFKSTRNRALGGFEEYTRRVAERVFQEQASQADPAAAPPA